MKRSSHLYLAIILHLTVLQLACAQDQKDIQELETYIGEARQLFEIPGLAIAIVKDGKIVMNEGFGTRIVETGDPVDSRTIFGIASCSKAFTAACLGILVDDSLIRWDDRVIDHYPEFKLNDPCITNEMRVQDLVSHRSGFETFDGDLLWYGTDYSRAEVVERIRYRDISYSFRSRYGYQNVMFIAAGELISKVTGKTWDEFVTERILVPLNMSSTSTSNSVFTDDMNLAYPHVDGVSMDFIDYDNCGPAASMNTCTDDLVTWINLWLNKGLLENDTIFSKNQYYKLTSPHTLINAGPGETIGGRHFFAYGLGWFMFDYEGRKVIQHGGGLPGFHSKVVLVPEDNLGFVILANELSGLVEAVYKKILDFYVSDDTTDWAQMYHAYQVSNEEYEKAAEAKKNAERKTGTSPSFDLKKYTGTYEDIMYGKAKVELNDDRLSVTLLPTKELFTSDLEHWENDTFRITFKDPYLPPGYISFHNGDGTGISSFTIDLENPDFHFYKLKFEKID